MPSFARNCYGDTFAFMHICSYLLYLRWVIISLKLILLDSEKLELRRVKQIHDENLRNDYNCFFWYCQHLCRWCRVVNSRIIMPLRYLLQTYVAEEERTVEDLKAKYDAAREGRSAKENMVHAILRQYDEVQIYLAYR